MTAPKVLYIVGKGRSGSTILDLVLGQIPGFFSAGELFRIWDWGLKEGYRCGCGRRVADCEVWGKALDMVLTRRRTPRQVSRWQREVLRWPSLPRLLRPPAARGWTALTSYAAVMRDLYDAVAQITGARVIVDSSKWPAHPGPLGLIRGIDPYAVHLVRDPRAVAHSWRRPKAWTDRAPGEQMPRFGAVYTSLSWTARNLLADRVRRRLGPRAMLLRYETFARRPGETLGRIARLVGEGDAVVPVSDEGVVGIETNHTVSGNPSRMAEEGRVTIREDAAWRGRAGDLGTGVVSALTAPLRGRYGYGR